MNIKQVVTAIGILTLATNLSFGFSDDNHYNDSSFQSKVVATVDNKNEFPLGKFYI